MTSTSTHAASTGASVEIVEVGPRDGLQSESQVLSTEVKVEFVRRLAAAGLPRIEVASFVNPKRVPQMADAEAVLAALAEIEPRADYIGLVLNRKGFDRARDAGCPEVGMAIAATESFRKPLSCMGAGQRPASRRASSARRKSALGTSRPSARRTL